MLWIEPSWEGDEAVTERQAWLKLAKAWEAATVGDDMVWIGFDSCWGLCHGIDLIGDYHVEVAMRKRLDEHGPPKRYNPPDPYFVNQFPRYRWELGDHKGRAKFCRRMAQMCEREAKNRKKRKAVKR